MKIASVILILSAICSAPAAAEERATKREMKGMELYSWEDSQGRWIFALVTGTNRLKTEAEIKAPDHRIESVETLRKQFGRLAEGEHVGWTMHRFVPGFTYPDDNTMKAVISAAKEAKVQLILPPKENRS